MALIPELVKNRIENKPHAARFFFYIANALYLPFYETKFEGTPPYNRPTLVALILYSLFEGQFTAEDIHEFAKYNLGAIWILDCMILPSAKTISRVLNDILDNIELIFKQVVQLCQAFDLIGQEKMYIDGTKTKANASKHKAMSYKYMCKKIEKGEEKISGLIEEVFGFMKDYQDLNDEELKQLIISESKQIYQESKAQHQAELKAEKAALFSGKEVEIPVINTIEEDSIILNQIDNKDITDVKESMDSIGFNTLRLDKMQKSKELLEETWQKENGNKPIPNETQINFTDPESSIMTTKHHGVQQCYNHFALVDKKAHVIVGAYTTNSPGDNQSFIPTVENADEILGLPENIVIGADAGFFSAANIEYALNNAIDFYASFPEADSPYAKDKFIYDEENDQYTCPEGEILKPGKNAREGSKTTAYKTESCLNCPAQSKCTKAKDGLRKIIRHNIEDKLREEAKEKATTPEGKEILRMRKSVPEPVWGNMKEQDDLAQLHYRGLDKAGREFILRCVMHNSRKLFKVFAGNVTARNEIIVMGSKPFANVI
jgi:transposase